MSTTNELLTEFERLVAEGGVDLCDDRPINLEPRYNCDHGIHKWRWYVGFAIEQYWYCEVCDLKDRARFPPTSRY